MTSSPYFHLTQVSFAMLMPNVKIVLTREVLAPQQPYRSLGEINRVTDA